MLLELLSESPSVEKSRRAVLTVALLILFFSSVDFRSDEIEIFALKVAFSQDRFVALGQICLFYFLILYSMRILIKIGSWGANFGVSSVENWEKSESKKITDAMNPMTEDEYLDGQYSDDYGFIKMEAEKHKVPYKFLEKCVFFIDTASRVFFEYLIPIIIAIVALVRPSSLSDVLKFYMEN
jgi:hypothetical protein